MADLAVSVNCAMAPGAEVMLAPTSVRGEYLAYVIEVAMGAYNDVILLRTRIERLVVIVDDGVGLEKCPQTCDFCRHVPGCPAAARVNENQNRGIDFGIDERIFAQFIVFYNQKCSLVKPRASKAC